MRIWQHWDPDTATEPIRPECSSTNSHFHEKLTPSVWGGWYVILRLMLPKGADRGLGGTGIGKARRCAVFIRLTEGAMC